MHPGYFDLWHVTTGAISYAGLECISGPGSRFCVVVSRLFSFQTFCVVIRRLAFERPMRIVARHARDTGVQFIVAPAVEDSIWLESYVVDPKLAGHSHHLIEASMAPAA